MGNGAKAQMKRDRAQKGATEAKSQLKINEQAKNVLCGICKQSYMCTVRSAELEAHAMNKHKSDIKGCFAGFEEMPSKKASQKP